MPAARRCTSTSVFSLAMDGSWSSRWRLTTPYRAEVSDRLRCPVGISSSERSASSLAASADAKLKRGNTAQALATWNDFLDCAGGVQSVRIDDGVSNIAARLPLIGDTAGAQALGERLASRG